MSIIISILIIAFLVFIHELGHFLAAKRAGVLVEEFGIGFPPRLFSWRRGETLYTLNLLPLGGFVKIYGEGNEFKDDLRSFASRSILTRAGIVSAGVAMNALFGMVLLIIAYSIGFPSVVTPENKAFIHEQALVIADVLPHTPAANAGLKSGDIVQAVQGTHVDAEGLKTYVSTHSGSALTFSIDRGGTDYTLIATPRATYPPQEGSLGIALVDQGMLRYPVGQAMIYGIRDSAVLLGKIVAAFLGLLLSIFHGGFQGSAVSGPVGVFVIAGRAVQNGLRFVLPLIILITFNLAVMNVLPFPALDGGRLLFFAIEKIKGKPVDSRLENTIHGIGFAVLLLLMVVLTVGDIKHFFW
ncbi:MAG: site-2 protease family protein [Patescibacteria group bacterium]|nr:site-2 protease family protein [Patescibacteria group bacterium]MDE2437889.1 site-2 protease family protein [Patescibacteria group bacterium]